MRRKRTNPPISRSIIYNISNEPLIIPKTTFDTLLRKKDFSNLFTLYCLQYYVVKYHKANLTIRYIVETLGVDCDKAKELENTLVDLGLMKETIHTQTSPIARMNVVPTGGRTGVRAGAFLKKEITRKKKKDMFDVFLNMFKDEWKDDKSFQEELSDFVIHRKQKGNSLTPIACKRLANHLSKFKLPIVIQAINRATRNGWTGIFPESETESKTKSKSKYSPPYKEWEGRRYYLNPDGEYRNKAGSIFIE